MFRRGAIAAVIAYSVTACGRTPLDDDLAIGQGAGGAKGTGAGGVSNDTGGLDGAGGASLHPCVTSLICPPRERCEVGFCTSDTACPPPFAPRLLAGTDAPELAGAVLEWKRIQDHEYLGLVGHYTDRAPAFLDLATGRVTKTTLIGAQCATDLNPCYDYDLRTTITIHEGFRLAGNTWTPSTSRTLALPVHSALFDFTSFPAHFHATGWSANGDGHHELFDITPEGGRQRLVVRTIPLFETQFGDDGKPRRLFMNDYADGAAQHAVAEPKVTPEWQYLFAGGSNLTGLIPFPDGAYALVQALDQADIPPDRAYPTWAVWKLRPGDQQRLGYVSLPLLRDLMPLYARFHYGKEPLVEGTKIQTTVCDMTDSGGATTCRLLRLELEPPAVVELASVRIPSAVAFVRNARALACGAEEVVIAAGPGRAYLARLSP